MTNNPLAHVFQELAELTWGLIWLTDASTEHTLYWMVNMDKALTSRRNLSGSCVAMLMHCDDLLRQSVDNGMGEAGIYPDYFEVANQEYRALRTRFLELDC